jgi:hypothetical protein
LEGRDEQLTAFVGKLRENLIPLRNDLDKVDKTRDEQQWIRAINSNKQQLSSRCTTKSPPAKRQPIRILYCHYEARRQCRNDGFGKQEGQQNNFFGEDFGMGF